MVVGTGVAQAVAPVEAYAAAMQMSDEMGTGIDSGEPIHVRRLRHVTQAVVDQILRDPGSLVALTTIKDFDRYLISHSTNVAVLSVLLGQRLGLSKSRLGELCLAAFLHDAGKLEVVPDVLHKPGALDLEEWEEMRRHPVLAAYTLLGAGRCTPSSMMAVVVAFEHHLNHDLSGYPSTELKDRVTLFGSIVAVADRYDALTTARVYREYNYTPYEALSYLIGNAGTLFDPDLGEAVRGDHGSVSPRDACRAHQRRPRRRVRSPRTGDGARPTQGPSGRGDAGRIDARPRANREMVAPPSASDEF